MKVIMYLVLLSTLLVGCGKPSNVTVNTHGDRITALEQKIKDLMELESTIESIELQITEIENTLIILQSTIEELKEAIESGEVESALEFVTCSQGDGIRLADGTVVIFEKVGNSSNFSLKALTLAQSNACN